MRRFGPANAKAIVPMVLSLLASLASSAAAQLGVTSQFELVSNVQLAEVDSAARAHLERVDALLANQQWDEAVETLRQLMEDHGERMIQFAPGNYLTLRQFGHARIARLPPAAFQLYRDRLDPLARQWFTEGAANRDRPLLGQVVESLFCTSYGDDALLALGELELERGNYQLARYHWERISPLLKTDGGRPLWQALAGANLDASWPAFEKLLTSRDTPPDWVAYPDTDLDLAEVRARLALVSILEGHWDRAALEIEVLRRLHPQASGKIGGREANFAERLRSLLEQAQGWPSPPTPDDWTTFAGNPRRNRNSTNPFRLAGPAWPDPITLGEPLMADGTLARAYGIGGRRIAEDSEGLLSYHPAVVDGLVFWSNQLDEIFAFDLQTGAPAWQTGSDQPGRIYKPSRPGRSLSNGSRRNHLGVARYTVSIGDHKLLARLGPPATSSPPEGLTADERSYLVCLDLERQGQLLWEIEPDKESWAFEGTPVTDGRFAYVALRRSDVRPQAHVVCYDLLSGRKIWQRDICAAETPARGQLDEVTHNLLTLDEGTLYYNTNLGAIAALDAADGTIRWITLYPRVAKGDLAERSAYFYRDLTPCVSARGILYAAPSDCRKLLAIDSLTGRLLWANELPSDVVHLLGVAADCLLASGDRLWWLDIATGKAKRNWPESESSDVRGYGRGLLAGDQVYFPTRRRIYVFPAAGPPFDQTQEPILLSAHSAESGNLVLADGHLLIASATQLFAFCEQGRRREQLQIEVSQHPAKALPHFQLAQLDQSHNDLSAATAAYRRAGELVRADEVWQGRLFREVIREALFEVLDRRIASQVAADQWVEAARLVGEAAAAAATPGERLRIDLRSAELKLARGEASAAIQEYLAIAADPELNNLTFDRSAAWSLAARLHVQETVSEWAQKQGVKSLELVRHHAQTLGSAWPLQQLADEPAPLAQLSNPPRPPLQLAVVEDDRPDKEPFGGFQSPPARDEITRAGSDGATFVWRVAPLIGRAGPLPDQPATMRVTLDDRSSGRRLWTHDLNDASPESEIALLRSGEYLFVLVEERRVHCFDALTGARRWPTPLDLHKPGQPGAATELAAIGSQSLGDRNSAMQLISVCGGLVRSFDVETQRPLWEVDLADSQSQRLFPWRIEHRGDTLAVYPGCLYSPGTFRFAYIDPAAGRLVYRSQPLDAPSGNVRLDWSDRRITVYAGDKRWMLVSRQAGQTSAAVSLNEKD